MIEKLDKYLAHNINSCNMSQNIMVAHTAIEKINEIVDLLNAIVVDVDGTKCIDGSKAPADNSEKANCQENVQQISYIAPGNITVFHGFNCSVEFDTPLPKGTRITIKSITKGV